MQGLQHIRLEVRDALQDLPGVVSRAPLDGIHFAVIQAPTVFPNDCETTFPDPEGIAARAFRTSASLPAPPSPAHQRAPTLFSNDCEATFPDPEGSAARAFRTKA